MGAFSNSPLVSKKLRAVVCQSEWIIAEHCGHALSNPGFQVVGLAQSCQAAIALTVIERPDVLLMEACSEMGVSGLDAARVILATRPVCIILLADMADEEYERLALSDGVARVLVKPIDSKTLTIHVREAYASHCRQIPEKFKVRNESGN